MKPKLKTLFSIGEPLSEEETRNLKPGDMVWVRYRHNCSDDDPRFDEPCKVDEVNDENFYTEHEEWPLDGDSGRGITEYFKVVEKKVDYLDFAWIRTYFDSRAGVWRAQYVFDNKRGSAHFGTTVNLEDTAPELFAGTEFSVDKQGLFWQTEDEAFGFILRLQKLIKGSRTCYWLELEEEDDD